MTSFLEEIAKLKEQTRATQKQLATLSSKLRLYRNDGISIEKAEDIQNFLMLIRRKIEEIAERQK